MKLGTPSPKRDCRANDAVPLLLSLTKLSGPKRVDSGRLADQLDIHHERRMVIFATFQCMFMETNTTSFTQVAGAIALH
jgi:hypothetical protein